MKNITINSIKKLIIDQISLENRPILQFILFKKIIKNNKAIGYINVVNFNLALNELIDLGIIKKLKNGKLVIGYINGEIDKSKKLIGTISINSKNCGFITLDNAKKSEYFVFKTNLNCALDGDKVEFYPMLKKSRNDSNLQDAVVDKVISHNKEFYVCIFNIENEQEYALTADANNLYLPIILDDITGLVNGQKILVQITKFEKDRLYGTVSKIIGHKNDPGVDILSIVLDKGVNPDFDSSLLAKTQKIKFEIDEKQNQLRRDLTDKCIVTIDPATSKDFDDAIYVERNDDKTYQLFVSIADVASYVKYQTELDEVAKTRGTSIYLVDRVIPMLPHILSDDICSLNPNKKRFALTCEMTINKNGEIISKNVYPSIIKSHRRFSYDVVNQFFNNENNLKNDDNEVKEMLTVARELHHILDRSKFKRGYINFNVPEVEIILDKNNFPIEIKKKLTGEAQQMIENFMLAANEAVTLFAHDHNVPFIYRIHDKPNKDKIKSLLVETKKLNFKINTNLDNIQPKDLSTWFELNKDNPNIDLINILMLRSMAKAEYSTINIGHFGLALQNYTHFTSPIRRYPDLMVGRLFWMYIFDKESYSDKIRNQFVAELDELCKLSSKNEIVAIECERDVNSMKFAEYMTRHLGEQFEGFVSSISKYGAFIKLPNTIEGLIRLSDLGNDYFIYNEDTNELIGKNTGLRYTLGTKVLVEVISANKDTKEINFKLIKHLGNR